MTITRVGATLGGFSQKTSGQTTIPLTTTANGNLFVMYSAVVSTSISSNTMSGGGITTWSKGTALLNSAVEGNVQLWWGLVTSAGTANATQAFTGGTIGSTENDVLYMEFHSDVAGTWGFDKSAFLDHTGNSTTVTLPTITPVGSNELWAGYAFTEAAATIGSTPGFTYFLNATSGLPYLWNPSVSSAVTPTLTQASSTASAGFGALFTFTPTAGTTNSNFFSVF